MFQYNQFLSIARGFTFQVSLFLVRENVYLNVQLTDHLPFFLYFVSKLHVLVCLTEQRQIGSVKKA